MVNKIENDLKITINQDKLIDILMHAATREDINKLDRKVDKLEVKVDKLEVKVDKLDAKIDSIHAILREDINKLDAKIAGKLEKRDFEKFEVSVDARFDKVDARFDKLEAKYDKILWGIILAILVPVSTQIFLQFIK